jgi:hypothetical protein
MNPYRIWRRELHELQLKVQHFDETFDYENRTYEECTAERKPLVDAIEAHYTKEGDAVAASEA